MIALIVSNATCHFSRRNSRKKSARPKRGLYEYPSVPHRPPQFNTSVPLLDHTFSAPKIPQFHTKNPSVQHQNPLSSTPKTPQFKTPPSVPHLKPLSSTHPSGKIEVELRGFWCGTEECVELRGFKCGTEGVVLNWGVFGVELRDFWGWKGVVQKWNWCVELRGSVWNWGVLCE